MKQIARSAITLSAVLLLAGCHVLRIVDPPGSNLSGVIWTDAPVTPLSIELLDGYVSPLNATLDGQPISGFSPTPAKNTFIKAPAPRYCDVEGMPGKPSDPPVSPARYMHEFYASAETDWPTFTFKSDTLQFVPPSLYVTPIGYRSINLGQTFTFMVSVSPGPKAPLQLTLLAYNANFTQPFQPTISINGQPAGQPATMTLPNNAPGYFTVTGVSLGSFVVKVNGPGVHCGGVAGMVRRG